MDFNLVTDELFGIWVPIGRLLRQNADVLRDLMRPDFLRMLDYFRALDTDNARCFLELWLKIGTAVKISEADLREELKREREALRGDLLGCSWSKCMMYEQEFANDTYMCAGCRNAAYCELSCQKR